MNINAYVDLLTDAGEDGLAAKVASHILKHIAPCVLMGFGRGSLAHTFQAVMHVFFLLATTPHILDAVIKAVSVWCTDYGIESGIGRVLSVPFHEVFPFLKGIGPASEVIRPICLDDHEEDFQAPIEDEFAGQPPAYEQETLYADVTGSLEVPGLLHVLHNLGKGLEDKLEEYKDGIARLTKVANILRRKESKDRLQETCFEHSQPAKLLFKKHLKRFRSWCYSDRWGTVSKCLLSMTPDLQATLEHGWSLDKYLAGSSRHAAITEHLKEDADDEHASRLDIVDETILSVYWWQYWQALRRVALILHECLIWAESCPCHEKFMKEDDAESDESDDEPDDDPKPPRRKVVGAAQRAARKCPLRGRRCSELAAGDILKHVETIYELHTSELLAELRASLTSEQKQNILHDFELSRAHVVIMLTLKLSHWQIPPHIIFGMAHYKPEVAFDSYLKVMSSSHGHPLLERLRSPALAAERAYYEELKGNLPLRESPDDAPGLRALIGELRLAPCSEREGEGVHAVVHRSVSRARIFSVSLISLANRFPQLKRDAITPDNFDGFASLLRRVPHGRAAVEAIGLGSHPVSASLDGGRERYSRKHFDVIYRADNFSKYGQRPPHIVLETRSERVVPGATFMYVLVLVCISA
jgi:hypothetical protein